MRRLHSRFKFAFCGCSKLVYFTMFLVRAAVAVPFSWQTSRITTQFKGFTYVRVLRVSKTRVFYTVFGSRCRRTSAGDVMFMSRVVLRKCKTRPNYEVCLRSCVSGSLRHLCGYGLVCSGTAVLDRDLQSLPMTRCAFQLADVTNHDPIQVFYVCSRFAGVQNSCILQCFWLALPSHKRG